MARGRGGGGGGDISREAINRGTAIIRGNTVTNVGYYCTVTNT